MNIKSIGLENFRLLKNNSFDFSDIVILTGANNSGKSTLLKALLLISKSFKKFNLLDYIDLKGNKPNLGSFNNIKTENSEDNKITISLPFEFWIAQALFVDDLVIKMTFSNENSKNDYYPELIMIQVFDKDNVKILDVKAIEMPKISNIEKNLGAIVNKQDLYFNFSWYREKITKAIKYHKDKPAEFKKAINATQSDFLNYIDSVNFIVSNDEYFSHFKDIEHYTHEVAYGWLVQERDYINGMKDKYSFFECFSWFFQECFPLNNINLIKYDTDTEDYPILNNFIMFADWISKDFYFSLSKLKEKLVDRISYLETYRGSIERLYSYNNENFNQLLSDFIEIEFSSKDPEYLFLSKWINNENFNFGDYKYFEILPISEFNANVVKLKKTETDEYGKALADFGYGTLQIFTILLKIIVEAKSNRNGRYQKGYLPHTILIEEPEANLHPKWQALLADMFIDASKTFTTQFIIESHSEYIIRRLQYNIAFGAIKANQLTLLNFTNKSIVTKLNIDEYGSLKTELGKDFFDEATTLKDELQQIQTMNSLRVENEKLKNELNHIKNDTKCVIFTEDKDSTLFTQVLQASGFFLKETELYSYEGCSNIEAAKLISKYIKDKFPNLLILIHKDRDYLSEEEVSDWKKSITDLDIFPFVTQGTEIEYYYINPKHINFHHNSISEQRAFEIVKLLIQEKKEISITNLKKHEFGEKYKNKKSNLIKYIEKEYTANENRYCDAKIIFKSLKQKIKDETSNNALIHCYSEYLKDAELETFATKIWKE